MGGINLNEGEPELLAIRKITMQESFSQDQVSKVIKIYFVDQEEMLKYCAKEHWAREDWKGLETLFAEHAETLNHSCAGESTREAKETVPYKRCRALIALCDRLEIEMRMWQYAPLPTSERK